MKLLKKIIVVLFLVLLLLFVGVYVYLRNDAQVPYDFGEIEISSVPHFDAITLPFEHHLNTKNHLPFMGAAVIDVDGDGQPEFWLGGGEGQEDVIFKYADGTFKDVTKAVEFSKNDINAHSYGAAVFDLDGDRDEDMLVCRSGNVFMYENEGGAFAKAKNINLPFNEKSVPISVTLGDYDNDGDIDFFVSAYIGQAYVEGQTIFTDPTYGATSMLVANVGNGQYKDVTKEAGIEYVHNTFVASFVDIDEDGHLDLIVSHDTGEIRTYKNRGDGTYEKIKNPLTDHFAYPMGISIGDYNNDLRPDFFASNVGTTMPRAILKGDLSTEQEERFVTDWILLRNEGGFNLRNASTEAWLAKYEFGWGSVFEDFNLDGYQDLAVAENYVSLPIFKLVKLPGRFLLGTEDQRFVASGQAANVINKAYGIAPITADFNGDGYPDLVYANVSGASKAWLSLGGDRSYIKVVLAQKAKSLGAKVVANYRSGKVRAEWLLSGEGLCSDQSKVLVFGCSENDPVINLEIRYANGEVQDTTINQINSTIYID